MRIFAFSQRENSRLLEFVNVFCFRFELLGPCIWRRIFWGILVIPESLTLAKDVIITRIGFRV